MYIYAVVVEGKDYYTDTLGQGYGKTKLRLEKLTGQRCLIAPFGEVNLQLIKELNPHALVISGYGQKTHTFDISSFYGLDEIIRLGDIPILGLCGGHQIIGFSLNKDIRNIERLYAEPIKVLDYGTGGPYHSHEPDVYTFVASGMYPIKRLKDDPIFNELPETMLMQCSHHCEVKKLPEGFEILAESEHCGIEAMRHKSRPIYGTQFHPEEYREPFFHGRKLLENFAAIADDFWANK